MFSRFFFACFLVITLLLCSTAAFAGKVELTTYYPAPYGEYKELKSTENANFATSSGNVGIGTTTPANKLDVEGGVAVGAAYSGTSGAPSNGMIIQGDVGIGTTAPENKLDVEGGVAFGAAYSGTSTAPSNGAIIQGSVGIGTAAPEGSLDVNGAIFFGPGRGKLYSANPGSLTTGCETVLTVNGGAGGANDSIYIGPHINSVAGVIDLVAAQIMINGVTTYTSDISLKKDIATIPGALQKVCDLRGVTYRWKNEARGQAPQVGVIAQEVEKVFPEMVVTDKNGIKSVIYNELIPPLIEAIKEQQQQIDLLKKEVSELQKK
jgi:hypothetical protein